MENPIAYYNYMHKKHYVTKFLQFRNSEITEEIWLKFCDELFQQIVVESKDVMVRLKK